MRKEIWLKLRSRLLNLLSALSLALCLVAAWFCVKSFFVGERAYAVRWRLEGLRYDEDSYQFMSGRGGLSFGHYQSGATLATREQADEMASRVTPDGRYHWHRDVIPNYVGYGGTGKKGRLGFTLERYDVNDVVRQPNAFVQRWTYVAVPWVLIVALLGLPPAAYIVATFRRVRRARRDREGRCPACGYDLRASPGKCPECGAEARMGWKAAPSSEGAVMAPRLRRALLATPVGLVVAVCCVLPLAWLLWQILANPSALAGAVPSGFQLRLLTRTLAYSAAVAAVATAVALPAAVVLGRGRGWVATVMWFALPVSLLMPSIAYAYGWSQFLRIARDGTPLVPGGPADVLRCILTLAGWLWPIPAGVIGLALRRVDVNLQQQALLDGALWRVTARQVAGSAAAAAACVTVLASQEFAVYEPTGISVVATEVRMVFETGLYSSPTNPINAPMGGGGGAMQTGDDANSALTARAAAAVATAFPLLVVTAVLGAATAYGARRLSAAEEVDVGAWPRVLSAGRPAGVLALLVLLVTLVVPTASMVLSLSGIGGHSPLSVLRRFAPQLSGSLLLAATAGAVAVFVAFWGAVTGGGRWGLAVSLATFLLGGQLLAIALIHLYNRDALRWVYDGPVVVAMAYFARFGWLALLAAAMTGRGSRPWRGLRDQAALDGADDFAAARHVVWPLAWPVLGASAVLVAVLSLTEVPATVLISPLRPQPLVPMLMTWVHMLRYDDMLEGSLMLMSIVLVLGVAAAGLVALFVRVTRRGGLQRFVPAILYPLFSILLLSSMTGCGNPNEPDEIWLRTGAGPGQTVYPRCIDYSPGDDTFFVVDRMARVQHLTDDGEYVAEWLMPDSQTGKPTGVTVGPDGNIYVPDTHYQRVIVYDPKTRQEIRRWGSMGRGAGQFIYPTDVAFDEKGNVFVSEYGDNDRIQVFTKEGQYLYQFGKPGRGDGELARPQSMVIEGGFVYVTDASNHRIAVFRTDGTWVRNMGSVGHGLGQFRWPYGLAMDRRGNLVVCEFGNNRVQLVDKQTGRGLKTWGSPGRGPGELAYPWAVAVDKRDRVVVVDAGNNRLQVFEF